MAYRAQIMDRVLFKEKRDGRTLLITRRDDCTFWLATVLYDDGERYSKAFHNLKEANDWLGYNG